MTISKTIKKAYDSVRVFNDIAGNLTNVDDKGIDNQLSLIFEELCEGITALEEGDRVGLLDGALDMFVVVAGLMQKLEAQGYDVAEGLNRVTANNLTKFPELGSVFSYDSEFKAVYNPKHKRTAIIDANGKVRKPKEYMGVYLTDLLPATTLLPKAEGKV